MPVSNWNRKCGAHTELLVYEDKSEKNRENKKEAEGEDAEKEKEEITPAQIAVVDSLLANGHVLNLKANFIDKLPDINPLKSTVTYINLSYNHFEVRELYLIDGLLLKLNN